ncbi:MAG: tRNA ((37)-N6)-threonylcarbamoyltransferase complex dimerization subunit type 1 TsaB [Pseudomonadota bacterium]|jgi:tRNA threonylcarbamoyladenosine biosynthesis protein TsaB
MTQNVLSDGHWLAISTATDVEAAALFDVRAGQATLRLERRERWRRGQPRRCLAHLEALLAEAPGEPVAGILVEVGPGSFTGVRLGLAVARALAYADGIPALGVDSFALARAAAGDTSAAVLLAARPRHVYLDLPGAPVEELPITEAVARLQQAPHRTVAAEASVLLACAIDADRALPVELPALSAMPALAARSPRAAEPIYVGVSEAERTHGIVLPDSTLPVTRH